MANEKRLIDASALMKRFYNYYDCVNEFTSKGGYRGDTLMDYEVADMIYNCIDNAPTVDAVPLDQYNELKERYKRLLETADILDSALRAYQRKYGDLDDEDAKMDGGNDHG